MVLQPPQRLHGTFFMLFFLMDDFYFFFWFGNERLPAGSSERSFKAVKSRLSRVHPNQLSGSKLIVFDWFWAISVIKWELNH